MRRNVAEGGGEGLLVLIVLFVLSGAAACLGLWSLRRHTAMAAWDRELAAAFGQADRKEMPHRRVL
jgi:hypothetical protein